jgi:hypothetical protein
VPHLLLFLGLYSCARNPHHHHGHGVAPSDNGNVDPQLQQTAHQRLTMRLAQLRQKRSQADDKANAEEIVKADEGEVVDQQPGDVENQVPPLVPTPAADETKSDTIESLRTKSGRMLKPGDKENPLADDTSVHTKSSKQRDQQTTLTVTQFKALWSSMESKGSFQCRLREPTTMHTLVQHMRKQGFHIVFSTSGASAQLSTVGSLNEQMLTAKEQESLHPMVDLEVGICNIRAAQINEDESKGDNNSSAPKEEPWFLARFIVSNNIFSAVMKCADADLVRVYVKKFALAKTLKIDTANPL